MAVAGRAALYLTLALLAYGATAGSLAAVRGHRRLALSARTALLAAFASTALAAGVLVAAFLRRDFSRVYVAQHSSRQLPFA